MTQSEGNSPDTHQQRHLAGSNISFPNRREPIRSLPSTGTLAFRWKQCCFQHRGAGYQASSLQDCVLGQNTGVHTESTKQEQMRQMTLWARFISCMIVFLIREKDSSNYRELRLLHWPPPAASCKVLIHRVFATKNTCSVGSYSFFNITHQTPCLCSARTQHSASVSTSLMQHKDYCGNLSNGWAATPANEDEAHAESSTCSLRHRLSPALSRLLI